MKTAKGIFYSTIFAILFFLLIGCESKKIVGIVQDPFGNGVEGVSIQILKSEFKTTTDKSGHYAIDYASGVFTIKFLKSGYTTHNLDLTINEKIRFPAEVIVIYPIPQEKGIYYLGEKSLQKLEPAKIKSIRGKDVELYSLFQGEPIIKSGKTIFVYNYGHDILHHLEDTRLFSVSMKKLSSKIIPLQSTLVFFTTRDTIGEEKLPYTTVELEQGNYTWLKFDNFGPQFCFPFKVSN